MEQEEEQDRRTILCDSRDGEDGEEPRRRCPAWPWRSAGGERGGWGGSGRVVDWRPLAQRSRTLVGWQLDPRQTQPEGPGPTRQLLQQSSRHAAG